MEREGGEKKKLGKGEMYNREDLIGKAVCKGSVAP